VNGGGDVHENSVASLLGAPRFFPFVRISPFPTNTENSSPAPRVWHVPFRSNKLWHLSLAYTVGCKHPLGFSPSQVRGPRSNPVNATFAFVGTVTGSPGAGGCQREDDHHRGNEHRGSPATFPSPDGTKPVNYVFPGFYKRPRHLYSSTAEFLGRDISKRCPSEIVCD